MPRPFNRAQSLQNQAFLAALRQSGNVRATARALGLNRAMLTKRRARDAAFAAEWDAALAVASAALQRRPGERAGAAAEPRAVRTPSGRLQLRCPPAGGLTRRDEQAFLAALGATANVRLSAKAAGFAHSSFYARARRSPAFAREMRLAIERGYSRIEWALLESLTPSACRDDAWRHNDPPPIPPMTAAQAIQLLHLHNKTARLWADRPDRRRQRGEATADYSARLGEKWAAGQARDEEDRAVAAALRAEPPGAGPLPFEPPPPLLPALDQVTGWSTAKPPATFEDVDPARVAPTKNGRVRVRDPQKAMFGGWRIGDRWTRA